MPARFACILAVLAACSACSDQAGTSPPDTSSEETIACAVGGVPDMTEVCAVERVKSETGLELVVHHPDGGFRRFEVRNDGTGLIPADGADEASSRIDGDILELAVGIDRYRFPAKVKGNDEAP